MTVELADGAMVTSKHVSLVFVDLRRVKPSLRFSSHILGWKLNMQPCSCLNEQGPSTLTAAKVCMLIDG